MVRGNKLPFKRGKGEVGKLAREEKPGQKGKA